MAKQSGGSFLVRLSIGLGQFLAGILLILYVVIPMVAICFPQCVSYFVFLYKVYCPLDVFYTDFEYYGFNSSLSRNFHLLRETANGEEVSLGAWHLLPDSLSQLVASAVDTDEEAREKRFRKALQSNTRVLFYVHGATGTRANGHRIQLYKVALDSNLQVFTFDYRGYGDSSGASRSERDAVDDTLAAHKWLLEAWHHENQQQEDAEIARRRGIVQWAHSLGTGITLRMLADLVDSIDDDAVLLRYLPETVVLESPFNDLLEAAHYYPIGMPYRFTPLLDTVVARAMNESGIRFASASNAARICRRMPSLHIMILHAADDVILPVELGRRLYNNMLQSGCTNVRFVEFPADLAYGHRHIHLAPEVHQILRNEA